jgi:hypothetical protein
MLTVALAVFAVAMCAMALAQESTTQPAAIDFERARQLIQRQRSGQTLSAEERAYVQAARGARQQQRSGRNGRGSAPPATQPMVPLDQMTATDRYRGWTAGSMAADPTSRQRRISPPSTRRWPRCVRWTRKVGRRRMGAS